MGLFVHEDVIVMVWPIKGAVLLAVSVHAGVGAAAWVFHSTVMSAALPVPVALLATTE